jgi:hypothetical protein
MQWQEQANIMVRHLINDVDSSNYKYTDDRIDSAVLVAAKLVVLELDFNNQYSINVIERTISPDPISDDYFMNLLVLKTAVVILGGEVKTEASNAISIKDGPSAIDLRGVSSTLLALYQDISKKYDDLVSDYGYHGSTGQAILGPYSPGSDYVTRTNSDHDFRSNYFRY